MAQAKQYKDFYKAFGDMKTPNLDWNGLFSLQRRHIEALSAANQALVEGAQAASKRQSEAVRETVEGYMKATKDILTSNSPENNTSRQVDFLRSSVENSMEASREIAETISRSVYEAFEILNKRATESVAEFSKVASAA